MKRKILSLLLFGAMLVGFCACDEPTDPFNGHEYVDLGLPSGTLWATCNVGATNPEDAGDYFAWGETQPKENYNWENEGEYKWGVFDGKDKTNYGMTKYNKKDSLLTLEAADDAATANWGGKWRMPTEEECQELLGLCYCEWDTTRRGYIITSRAEGNNNSIFLPAAGWCMGRSPNYVGSGGFYWSSSIETIPPRPCFARHLDLYIVPDYGRFTNSRYRYFGMSVRPVCSPQR